MLDRFFNDAGNSLVLAGVTAFIGVVIGILLAYGSRLSKLRRVNLAARVVSLGYAIPGPVVALGVLLPLAWFDRTIDAWFKESYGISTGYILSGTVFILVFAYLVRFLALAFGTAESGFGRITPQMEEASRSFTLDSWQYVGGRTTCVCG